MVGTVRLFSYGHCQANWLAVVVLTISEHIFPGIRLLQYASLHVMNIHLTLSHDGIPYFLLCHNLNILRFRCKDKQFFSNEDANSQ